MISAGAKGRESPTDRPATPDTAPAAAPLKRAPSFGGMWDWGFGRQEPSSPGSSVHNGEGKSMPWAMKLKFGTDSERPV